MIRQVRILFGFLYGAKPMNPPPEPMTREEARSALDNYSSSTKPFKEYLKELRDRSRKNH